MADKWDGNLKVNQTADLVEYVSLAKDRKEKARRIFWTLSGAMTRVECQDIACKEIQVSKESYAFIVAYLNIIYPSFHPSFPEFMGATIVVDPERKSNVPWGVG